MTERDTGDQQATREDTMRRLALVDPELRMFIKQVVYQVLGEMQMEMAEKLPDLSKGIVRDPSPEWLEQNARAARPQPYWISGPDSKRAGL